MFRALLAYVDLFYCKVYYKELYRKLYKGLYKDLFVITYSRLLYHSFICDHVLFLIVLFVITKYNIFIRFVITNPLVEDSSECFLTLLLYMLHHPNSYGLYFDEGRFVDLYVY